MDGNGQFDLWNLNADTEEPFVSTSVGSGRALNKIAWDKEGNKTAIGSSDGRVYVYDIGEVSLLFDKEKIATNDAIKRLPIPSQKTGICYRRTFLK